MAGRRDSFLFYRDWAESLKSYPLELKSELFDCIVDFALDNEEHADVSEAARLVFAAFRPKLMRDAVKYQEACERNKRNGSEGGRPKKASGVTKTHSVSENPKNPLGFEKPTRTDSNRKNPTEPDNDNDNDNDNINKKTKLDKSNLSKKESSVLLGVEERRQAFYDSLIPFISQYGKEMVRQFYDYWSELNKSKTKMRWESEKTWELERRLSYWSRRSNNYKQQQNGTIGQQSSANNPIARRQDERDLWKQSYAQQIAALGAGGDSIEEPLP